MICYLRSTTEYLCLFIFPCNIRLITYSFHLKADTSLYFTCIWSRGDFLLIFWNCVARMLSMEDYCVSQSKGNHVSWYIFRIAWSGYIMTDDNGRKLGVSAHLQMVELHGLDTLWLMIMAELLKMSLVWSPFSWKLAQVIRCFFNLKGLQPHHHWQIGTYWEVCVDACVGWQASLLYVCICYRKTLQYKTKCVVLMRAYVDRHHTFKIMSCDFYCYTAHKTCKSKSPICHFNFINIIRSKCMKESSFDLIWHRSNARALC
jgi:hypothetical protein